MHVKEKLSGNPVIRVVDQQICLMRLMIAKTYMTWLLHGLDLGVLVQTHMQRKKVLGCHTI